jgi:hypothetical protein
MKTKISQLLLLLMVAITLFNCSEQPVAPVEPTEDIATFAEAYSPNVFVLEITTVSYEPSYPTVPVELQIAGTAGGKIAINWGDGTIEKITLSSDYSFLHHQYGRVKNYTIKIDGEIKNIDNFGMSYQGDVKVNNMYLSGLTGLKSMDLSMVGGPLEVINLSHNKLIENLGIVDVPGLRDIIMPSTNNLTNIQITGTPQISTAAVDRVIGRVYESVVSNPRGGSFVLDKEWWIESNEMVGPPSGYSITKLKKLRDNYGWSISPDIDNH